MKMEYSSFRSRKEEKNHNQKMKQNDSKLFFGLVLMFFFTLVLESTHGDLCYDESGNSVGWWVILKIPDLKNTGVDPRAESGVGYYYADARSPTLKYSTKMLNQTTTALARTLKQVFTPGSTSGFYLYNDQMPNGTTTSTYGHTKGVVGVNSHGGYWLVHSVPEFPVYPATSFSFPASGFDNGQSFLCLALSVNDTNKVSGFHLYNRPAVYGSRLPSSVTNLPNFVKVLNRNSWVTSTGASSVGTITANTTSFTVFAKNAKWGKDLYAQLVAPFFKLPLRVEAWRNGVGNLPSYCTPTYPYNVENIKSIQIGPTASWNTTLDHSKWAISTVSTSPWVCIGDINRQSGQFSRGGGTVCTKLATLWSSFNKIITSYETC